MLSHVLVLFHFHAKDQSEKLQQAIDLLSSLTRSGTRSASSEPGTERLELAAMTKYLIVKDK